MLSESDIGIVNIFLKCLSWKNIFYVFIVASILVTLAIVFQNKFQSHNLPKISRDVKLLSISDQINHEIKEFRIKDNKIAAIQIVTLDLKKNIRVETYIEVRNEFLEEFYNKFVNEKLFETPIFDSDPKHNKRMINIINGDFVCVPYEDSATYQYAPAARQFIKEVCAISIPPHSGGINGIITFYITQQRLTDDEKSNLFLFSRNLSLKIAQDNSIRD